MYPTKTGLKAVAAPLPMDIPALMRPRKPIGYVSAKSDVCTVCVLA
jgi:hypothetical protein